MDLRFLSRNAETAKRSSHLQRRRGFTFSGAKIWEQSEDDALRATANLTVPEVQKRLPHRTALAIERRREKLDLLRRKLKPWTAREDRILRANIEQMDYRAIASLLPGCYSAWGLTLDRRPRLTPVDAQQRIVSTN